MIIQINRTQRNTSKLDYEFINDDSIVYAGAILTPVQIDNLITYGNTVIPKSLYNNIPHKDIIKEVKRLVEPIANKKLSFELQVIEHLNENENAIEELKEPTYLLIKVPEWYISIIKDGRSKYWLVKRDNREWNKYPIKQFKNADELIDYIEKHYKFKVANDVRIEVVEEVVVNE